MNNQNKPTMKKPICFRYCILFLIFSLTVSSIFAQQAERNLATKARYMIGKKDKEGLKINTLKSWDAVKYCAKKAGIITQSQSNALSSSRMMNKAGFKVKSLTKIPAGYLIGFYQKGRLVHMMISTGNGKAVGVNNQTAIGLGKNKVWEEISLQQLTFRIGYGTFMHSKGQISMVLKPASKILDTNYYKKNASKTYNRDDRKNVPYTKEGQNLKDSKDERISKVESIKWSKRYGYDIVVSYSNHKADFPEIRNEEQYAAKAHSMLRIISGANGRINFVNPNYKVHLYGDVFIYDKADHLFLRLDEERKPMLLQKLAYNEFKQLYEKEVKWDSKLGLKNKMKNAQREFHQHKKDFRFRTWEEYAYHAKKILETAKLDGNKYPYINVKRVGGDFLYFNEKTGVFVAANTNGEPLTMFKPKQGANYFISLTEKVPSGEYDSVTGSSARNEYESVSSALNSSIGVTWTKLVNTTAQKEYAKNKRYFPQIKSSDEYARKAVALTATERDANGKHTFKNKNLTIKSYKGNVYLYDANAKAFVLLDKDRNPITMERARTKTEFINRYKKDIGWSSVLNENDPILNAKESFKLYNQEFRFKRWEDFAAYAESLIENIIEKKKDPKISAQRNWQGDLVYFNTANNVIVLADRKNEVVAMYKLSGSEEDNWDYYKTISSSKDPVDPHRHNPQAIEEWHQAMAEYNRISMEQMNRIYTAAPKMDGTENGASEYDTVKFDDNEETEQKKRNTSEYDTVKFDEDERESTSTPVRKESQRVSTFNSENEIKKDVLREKTTEKDVKKLAPKSLLNPSVFDKKMPLKKTSDWAKKGNWPPIRVASLSYKKHKLGFLPQRLTIPQYVTMAHYFLEISSSDATILEKVLPSGNRVIYSEQYNLLGVYTQEGLPVLFSKPQNGQEAFDATIEEE